MKLLPFDQLAENATLGDEAGELPVGARALLILVLGLAAWALPLTLLYILR